MTDRIDIKTLEQEFQLQGNTPAAESDATAAVAAGDVSVEELPEPKGSDDAGIDTRTIEREIHKAEELFGLEDNLERYEVEKRHEQEDEAAAADDEAEEARAAEADEGTEKVDDDTAPKPKEGEEEAAPEIEEAAPEAEGDQETVEGEEGDPLRNWIREQLPDEDARQEFLSALMEEGVKIPYTANGQQLVEDLPTILRKAAGYAGEETVTRRSQEAKTQLEQARQLQERAAAAEKAAQARIEAIQKDIDDPEVFGGFLTERASLEYLEQLHTKIGETLERAQSNPESFQLSRRLQGIEQMLHEMRTGGPAGREAPDARQGEGHDTAEPTVLDPTKIPEDLGFIRGEGYPSQFSAIARREVRAILDAVTTAGVQVSYEDVVKEWQKEGRIRPIHDVAKGLIAGKRRDSQKLNLSQTPPVKRTPKKGRVGGGKPNGDAPAKKPMRWDDIEGEVARQLASAQASRELKT